MLMGWKRMGGGRVACETLGPPPGRSWVWRLERDADVFVVICDMISC
jgi:hypothetical protein